VSTLPQWVVGRRRPASGIEPVQRERLQRDLDTLLRSCIQCGLCLPHCATYLASGSEVQSPRGRLLLLREMLGGKLPRAQRDVLGAFDLCLGCHACESACPSGVSFELFEFAKDLAFRELPGAGMPFPGLRLSSRRGLRALRAGAGLARSLLRRLYGPAWRQRLAKGPTWLRPWVRKLGTLPRSPERDAELVALLDGLTAQAEARGGARSAVPPLLPPPGNRSGAPAVAFFRGCASDVLLSGSGRRLRDLLAAAGCRLLVPAGQECCGALAAHTGRGDVAARQRARNGKVLGAALAGCDALVVEAAGCGLELKGYPPEVAAKVVDAAVLLADLPLPALRSVPLRVVLHDPCHARHGQGIVAEPRRLLRRIPGLHLCEPEEAEVCCGSGGAYSLMHADLSAAMGRRKAEKLAATGADLVVTGNPGCLGQIADALAFVAPELPVIPLTDLVWYACRGGRRG
jgi:glycolate oxidase iron-sulfur subunit